MATSTGSKIVKTAVFISGTGSNLKSLIKFSKLKKSPISIKLIISNNPKSTGLKYANIFKIKKKIFAFKKITDEKKILFELKKDKIDLICLAGFMKILSKNFIRTINLKILNIHPSLLPKFKGLNTYERIKKNKEKKTGCTVHFVNEKLDSGKIILRKYFYISPNDSSKILKYNTQKLEYLAYPEAIYKIFRYN